MTRLQRIIDQYGSADCRDLGARQLEILRDELRLVEPSEITSQEDGKSFLSLLRKFREAVAENDKFHGQNYPQLLNSILSVGEDGLYSNKLRFIFELIQNVDDCDFPSPDDCRLEMFFDFNEGIIVLNYNEVGFTPFNVFAITGIAEAAKNISSKKNEIGEKGIGFKSVFGVANRVLIESGWFSFELHKSNFTIPVASYQSNQFVRGTKMTLFVPDRAKEIYQQIKRQYCTKDALFTRNPILFLNKLTKLKMYYDTWRFMEFNITRPSNHSESEISTEKDVILSVDMHDYENGSEIDVHDVISCTRYIYPVTYSKEACRSRYGENTAIGDNGGKHMLLQSIVPDYECLGDVGNGSLYSFLPTQLKLSVPVICHVPFKLDASREFVDPQGNNQWFIESCKNLSTLIDFTYRHLSRAIKEKIVAYLPGYRESLFARNNGKELCLSQQACFRGNHFLNLDLFFTANHEFKMIGDIFSLNQTEEITDPVKVSRLLAFSKSLFIPPKEIAIDKLGINTETNLLNRLFRKALENSYITKEALDYLDSENYVYSAKYIDGLGSLSLTTEQIRMIAEHPILFKEFQELTCSYVRQNTVGKITVKDSNPIRLSDTLYKGFELSETPKTIENYMRNRAESCVLLDIKEDTFLPLQNALILSEHNPLPSFAAFCYELDHRDTFAVRIKLHEASERLDQYVAANTGTAEEFLRELRNNRMLVRDSLGADNYKKYLRLIFQSGTYKERYIQEILQNADDCEYPADVIPTFSMSVFGSKVIAEYNEKGFTRANVRAITALGESTKNSILNGNYSEIGEKGIGFKMVFAVASKVSILSGEHGFFMTDQEPTIPKLMPVPSNLGKGTRLELTLKDNNIFTIPNEKEVLRLCLCLRKLRRLYFGGLEVNIEDTDNRRIVTIGRKDHVFRTFVHSFKVISQAALEERANAMREVSPLQLITCYYPEKNELPEYQIYTGLPTKHKLRVPLAVDAPFVLTTSREEIATDSKLWNDVILEEMYEAILEVIGELKEEKRSAVFRLLRFSHRMSGQTHYYSNEISDSEYINEFPFLERLRNCRIIPTFNPDVFVAAADRNAFSYPDAVKMIVRTHSATAVRGFNPASVIDVSSEEFGPVLNALSIQNAEFRLILPVILQYAERNVANKEFRKSLYECLLESPEENKAQLRQLALIPVYERIPNEYRFIAWKSDSIFVKRGANYSGLDYYVLDEELLPKADCEKIFGVNINEMNSEWERMRYNSRLERIICEKDVEKIYGFLLQEFKSGALERNDSIGTLLKYKSSIPKKNELDEIVDTELFISDQPKGYFPVDMIRKITVHPECKSFAKYIQCEELSSIHYEDLDYYEQLTDDDVETLLDDYFLNSEEILRKFYQDGFLPEELLERYELSYLTTERVQDDDRYDFPSDPVRDRAQMIQHVSKLLQKPVKIVTVYVRRAVQKGQVDNEEPFDLRISDAREGAMNIYAPEGSKKLCFCQMCRRVKSNYLIEVNCIESKPMYYYPQLRVALCLECSKRFEGLRGNRVIREQFLETVSKTSVNNQGTVEIPIGKADTITFTGKHLAEIQEIMKRTPKPTKV